MVTKMENVDIGKVEKVVIRLVRILKSRQYAFRGTTSLVLQGIKMNVSDIDIICDKETALDCNRILGKYLIEAVEYKVSKEFKSYFGKYKVDGIFVEIMGEWQIKDNKGWEDGMLITRF
jgi:hypothetical protein